MRLLPSIEFLEFNPVPTLAPPREQGELNWDRDLQLTTENSGGGFEGRVELEKLAWLSLWGQSYRSKFVYTIINLVGLILVFILHKSIIKSCVTLASSWVHAVTKTQNPPVHCQTFNFVKKYIQPQYCSRPVPTVVISCKSPLPSARFVAPTMLWPPRKIGARMKAHASDRVNLLPVLSSCNAGIIRQGEQSRDNPVWSDKPVDQGWTKIVGTIWIYVGITIYPKSNNVGSFFAGAILDTPLPA